MLLLDLLILQFALGAFDTLYHHEIKEQLPYRRGASPELRIHGIRALLYALIAVGLASFEWRGALAAVVGGVLRARDRPHARRTSSSKTARASFRRASASPTRCSR